MSSYKQVRFGVDLVLQTWYQIEFLKAANDNKHLQRPSVLKHALYRYEKFWLPLAAEHPAECLSAPMDIEWIWHCHMLSPQSYARDCNNIVGSIVNHTLYPADEFQRSRAKAQRYWSEKYREPFYVDFSTFQDGGQLNFTSRISYDILTASVRQAVFFYQVSLPHYKDRTFIEDAHERYKKFLFLRKEFPKEFLVPCYDIDVIWHSHQLNPLVYQADTVRITGSLFGHDDSVNDRTPGSKLCNSNNTTRGLWNDVYREAYSKAGTMYRGKPPNGLMKKLSQKDENALQGQLCKIVMQQVILDMSGTDSSASKHCDLIIGTAKGPDTEVKKLATLKPTKQSQSEGNLIMLLQDPITFQLDTSNETGIMFTLHHKGGIFSSKKSKDTVYLDLSSLLESTRGARMKSALKFPSTVAVILEFNIQSLRNHKSTYSLKEQPYQKGILPDDIQNFLGPTPLEILPTDANKQCRYATHILNNPSGKPVFKVRTIHCAYLMTSVIQVLHNDKLCAMAHLIAADQLPLLTQVSPANASVALHPAEGQRAMLIKNNDGDWALLLGQWFGLEQGRPGKKGSSGTLQLILYKMTTGSCIQTFLDYQHKNYTVTLESSKCDLNTGTVDIDSTSHEIAENVALVFAVSLLHVILVPRYQIWQEGLKVGLPFKRQNRKVKPVPSDNMKFIKAAGLHVDTPSNFYITKNRVHTWALFGARLASSDILFTEEISHQNIVDAFQTDYTEDAGCGGGGLVGISSGYVGGGCGSCGGGGCGGGGCGGGGCGG